MNKKVAAHRKKPRGLVSLFILFFYSSTVFSMSGIKMLKMESEWCFLFNLNKRACAILCRENRLWWSNGNWDRLSWNLVLEQIRPMMVGSAKSHSYGEALMDTTYTLCKQLMVLGPILYTWILICPYLHSLALVMVTWDVVNLPKVSIWGGNSSKRKWRNPSACWDLNPQLLDHNTSALPLWYYQCLYVNVWNDCNDAEKSTHF